MFDSASFDAIPAVAGAQPPPPGHAPAPPADAVEKFIENITYKEGIQIYNNLQHLLSARKTELKTETSILFFMNGDSGLGSQLTQFAQNSYFLYNHFNPNLYCYPYFYKNNSFFKYHEEKYGDKNTFFMFFRIAAGRFPPFREDGTLKLDNIYFVENRVYSYFPFFIYNTPPVAIPHNRTMIEHFYKCFNLRIGENVFKYIFHILENEKKPIIGLHIRSAFQKKHHNGNYLSIPIKVRLEKLKQRLQKQYGNGKYMIFLATDTNLYIQWCNEIFGNDVVQYIEDIERIDGEEDSVPLFKSGGFKLGCDILYDCLALSLCDCVFVSNSNVPFMINMLNMEIPMHEY